MHPLCRAVLDPLDHRAPTVIRRKIVRRVVIKAHEEERVSFLRFHRQFSSGATRRFRRRRSLAILRIGKYRLTAPLDVTEIHQHRRHALASLCSLRIDVVVKVIVVRTILLPELVSQHLKSFPVFHRYVRPRRDPPLNARDDFVFTLD